MGRSRGIQYRPGSFFRQDDRSGFTRRAGETEQEWTGLIVGKDLWESRQPQDFVRAVADDQTVPKARPVPPAVFTGPFFVEVAVAGAVGDSQVFLDNVIGITPGDPVGFFTDQGVYFYTNIAAIDYTTDSVFLLDALPAPVLADSLMTDFVTPKADVGGLVLTTEDGQNITTETGDTILT